jgi:hypothetical protein
MQDIRFDPLFWFFGVAGVVVGITGAAVIFLVFRLLQEHWH